MNYINYKENWGHQRSHWICNWDHYWPCPSVLYRHIFTTKYDINVLLPFTWLAKCDYDCEVWITTYYTLRHATKPFKVQSGDWICMIWLTQGHMNSNTMWLRWRVPFRPRNIRWRHAAEIRTCWRRLRTAGVARISVPPIYVFPRTHIPSHAHTDMCSPHTYPQPRPHGYVFPRTHIPDGSADIHACTHSCSVFTAKYYV